ncbi:MAG: hypothetical protein KGL01_06285 [Betaproteobacteria bacterium]|nr:hypothetical protein [Betaproteobacteria bacterium]
MAERLLAPDIRLYVYDTNQKAMEPFVKHGATACASPALVSASLIATVSSGRLLSRITQPGDYHEPAKNYRRESSNFRGRPVYRLGKFASKQGDHRHK